MNQGVKSGTTEYKSSFIEDNDFVVKSVYTGRLRNGMTPEQMDGILDSYIDKSF